MIKMNKKGYAMLLDSIAALTFILLLGMLIVHLYQPKMSQTSIVAYKNLHYVSEDILDVLNKKGVLDDIGTEWAVSNGSTNSTHFENATNLTKEYFDSLIPSNLGYRVLIDDTVIYDSDEDNTSNRIRESASTTETYASRLLVGYAAGLPTVGHIARAFLTNIREKETSAYAYFGGFVGQGNLSRVLTLPFNLYTVKQICMEYSSGDAFDLYIDGSNAGSFPASGVGMSSELQCVSNPETFISEGGTKTFEVKFSSNDLNEHYLGGGYIRVRYNTSLQETSPETAVDNYFFPGIEGLMNLYSSFYVPGTLDEMNISLNMKTNHSTYLNIGDVKVFNFTGDNNNQTFLLNDTYLQPILLAGGLNYMDLSENTVPIKLGTEGVGGVMIGNADAILATDLSGSMASGDKLTDAQAAAKEFVSIILNASGNNAGLVGYGDSDSEYSTETMERWNDCCSSSGGQSLCSEWVTACSSWDCQHYDPYNDTNDTSFVRPDYYQDMTSNGYSDAHIDANLTDDGALLNSTIDSYSANGGTCIGCGIHGAVKALLENGDPGHQWSIVIMTDGQATMAPIDSNASDNHSMEAYMPSDYECGDYSVTGKNAAVEAAREAYGMYNITVYTVGFGSGVNEDDLMEIAAAGNGTYYYADDADTLKEIYRNISQQILNSSYSAQILNVSGNITKSYLYPESYIRFRFTPSESNLSEYGEITLEQDTEPFNDPVTCTGNLFVTGNAVVTEARVTSYSAEHWTHELYVGGSRKYYLGDYGSNYTRLGDPYTVNIPEPVTNLPAGNNVIVIKTGNAPDNDTLCSSDNRAIYTIRLNSGVGYGDVFTERDGCIWNIQFEDDSEMSVSVPGNYTGTGECSYRDGNKSYDATDAIDDAIYRLLTSLDSNENDKLDIEFDSNMLEFSFTRSGGVRSLWGPANFKLVMWM